MLVLKENLREHSGVHVVQNKNGSDFGVLKELTLFLIQEFLDEYWKEFQEKFIIYDKWPHDVEKLLTEILTF